MPVYVGLLGIVADVLRYTLNVAPDWLSDQLRVIQCFFTFVPAVSPVGAGGTDGPVDAVTVRV